jgi:uncharacterized protein
VTIHNIIFDDMKLRAVASRYGIKRLALFGSILGPDFNENSDIDVLVEFLPGTRISLLGIGKIEMELEELFGRHVDLRTPQDLSQYFREDVVESARPLYAA